MSSKLRSRPRRRSRSRRFSNVEEWLFSGAKDQALAHKSDGGGGAASGAAPVVGAYGIRGRRGAMEDRIISREIK